MKSMKRNWQAVAVFLGVFGLVACNGATSFEPKVDPEIGDTDFISADQGGGDRGVNGDGAYDEAAPDSQESADDRTVEEGDIYRVLSDQYILNLNSYRGLQVIDFSNVAAPEVVGNLRISGYPVEMYAVGTRAYVLLNNYRGYYGSRHDVQVNPYEGGLVVAVDISDPTNPVALDSAQVPGWIATSRLTRGGGHEALYVVANNWDGESSTVVRSFALEGSELVEKSAIDLGGYVSDIQATTEALLVARVDWYAEDDDTSVSIIDISDPTGLMLEGAQIPVAGMIRHKSNMDLRGDILRVVSGSWWNDTNTNHLQTFNIGDLQNPVVVDHDTFGANEDLYGTLFMADRAFFVTYRRVDPFHAFSIDADGQAVEMSEYVISGWNDFFKPVLGNSRILGVGVDDAEDWTMAISLYDTTDLQNPEPLVARTHVGASWGWSEARWDDRAFTVLDGAVSVAGPEGQTETGLVLLPFSGYLEEEERYIAGVQIFTYSESSLSQRGMMEHGSFVRRSFVADDSTANLSESELSLFDASDPDNPVEQGRVELAPNYTQFFVFGDYGARLKYDQDYYWWWGDSSEPPANELQIVALSEDPDEALPVAVLDLPARAQVYKVGELAVAVDMVYVDEDPNDDEWCHETTIRVYDLSDPTQPVLVSTLVTRDISPFYGYYWWGGPEYDCMGCYHPYYYGGTSAYGLGQSLVFPSIVWEQEIEGIEHVCHTSPVNGYEEECIEDEMGNVSCIYLYGSETCRSLDNGPTTCSGTIQRCTVDERGWDEWVCEEVDPEDIETETRCYDQERYRYWNHLDLNALDLSDPAAPVLLDTMTMPTEQEYVNLMARGNSLYYSYKVPHSVQGDSRPYARFFVKEIDFSDPTQPEEGSGVNVPGTLIEVDGDMLYTQDYVWNNDEVESAINKLERHGNAAVLKARLRFPDQYVHSMLLDGSGHALVTHRLSWQAIAERDLDWDEVDEMMTVLDISGPGFAVASQLAVDRWASLRQALSGRALFSVPGGLLVVNLDEATAPFAQAYFPVWGWPQSLMVHEREITFAAGRYGMYRFGLDDFNLLED